MSNFAKNVPSNVKLLLLLLDPAVNLLSDLSKLQLGAKDFVFLLLKRCFSLFQSRLKLLLLYFQSPTLFVKLMNGATTITKLVKEVPDFISQVFVLSLHNIKLLNGFIMSSFESKELAVEVAALFLTSIDLNSNVICLCFPFRHNLKHKGMIFNFCPNKIVDFIKE